MGSITYKLGLLYTSKVRIVFHVSLLKRFCGDPLQKPPVLPKFSVEDQPVI